MTPEAILAAMLALGPGPGQSIYSQIEVSEGAPLVALRTFDVDGTKVRAYTHWQPDEALPAQCAQPKNVACRRPLFQRELKRWQRPETYAEGLVRYWTIAKAIASQPKDVHPFAVVIVRHESGFRRDVHAGENHRPFRQTTKHEDEGHSWCLGQIMIGRKPTSLVPWKGFAKTKAIDLVGTSQARTNRCLKVVGSRLTDIARSCRRRRAEGSCVFIGYAGTAISRNHPLMKARAASLLKVKRAPRKLGKQIRAQLGLKTDD